jgi:hypothetical protein
VVARGKEGQVWGGRFDAIKTKRGASAKSPAQ